MPPTFKLLTRRDIFFHFSVQHWVEEKRKNILYIFYIFPFLLLSFLSYLDLFSREAFCDEVPMYIVYICTLIFNHNLWVWRVYYITNVGVMYMVQMYDVQNGRDFDSKILFIYIFCVAFQMDGILIYYCW